MPRLTLHLALPIALAAGCATAQDAANNDFFGGPPEVPEFEPAFPEQFRAPIAETQVEIVQEQVVGGLVHPWGMDEMPDGRLIVTEQPGRMRIVGSDGSLSEPIEGVPEVVYTDQGGLLDVALAPDFEQSREVFFTFSQPRNGGTNATAAAKGRLSQDESRLENVEVIFQQQPPWDSDMHYGSRIVFEDDDSLWITLGERFGQDSRELAQDPGNTIGATVRINRDGSVPEGNPFAAGEEGAPEVWSYGLRNVQAAAQHPETGRLWIITHGPQGGDEINVLEPGANYGWPVVSYGEQYGGDAIGSGEPRAEGFVEPIYYWSPVIAPSGAAFYDGEMFPDWQGDLLVGGLVPQAVIRLELDGQTVTGEDRMVRGIGRVRDIEVADDGAILAAIDAEDGRIVRLTPQQ